MASFKYFLLCPFVFLCLSYTFANGVFNSNDGSGFGPRAWPLPDPSAGPGVDRGVSNVGAGPKAGPGPKVGVSGSGAGSRAGPKGVNSIVNGVEVGVGVGYGPRFGPPGFGPRPGYWPPVKRYDDCTLGYVCPASECSKFEYGPCESYHFRPLTASTDLHEVDINWAKSKPAATAQHGGSGPVIHIDSAH